MWSGHLAPDDTDLGALDLLLSAVDESDLLSEVEAVTFLACCSFPINPSGHSLGGGNIINTLNLDQACVGVGVALSTLVAQVATPISQSDSFNRRLCVCSICRSESKSNRETISRIVTICARYVYSIEDSRYAYLT